MGIDIFHAIRLFMKYVQVCVCVCVCKDFSTSDEFCAYLVHIVHGFCSRTLITETHDLDYGCTVEIDLQQNAILTEYLCNFLFSL